MSLALLFQVLFFKILKFESSLLHVVLTLLLVDLRLVMYKMFVDWRVGSGISALECAAILFSVC